MSLDYFTFPEFANLDQITNWVSSCVYCHMDDLFIRDGIAPSDYEGWNFLYAYRLCQSVGMQNMPVIDFTIDRERKIISPKTLNKSIYSKGAFDILNAVKKAYEADRQWAIENHGLPIYIVGQGWVCNRSARHHWYFSQTEEVTGNIPETPESPFSKGITYGHAYFSGSGTLSYKLEGIVYSNDNTTAYSGEATITAIISPDEGEVIKVSGSTKVLKAC